MSDNKCFCHFTDKETGESYEVKDATARRSLEDKVDKVEGKGLSTNDYTTEEKEKLAGLSNYDDTELRKQIPTKTSQLTNDSSFVTSSSIPTKTSQLTNDSEFITKTGFSMRASGSTPLRIYYNEGDGENFIDIKSPDIPKHTLSLVPSGTQIPKNNNLDLNSIDYIKVGLYYCPSDATTQTLSNRPTDRAFMMEVYTPLSTAVDNETTSQWVYRIRKLMTYTGDQYIQSVSSGSTVGSFTYGAWIKIANTNEIPSSSDFVKTSGTQTIGGLKTFSYDLNVGTSLKLLSSSNGGIEIGRTDGTTSTPYIDFHTDGATTDYNVRMIASGGTKGTNGDGTLNISAGKVTINGNKLVAEQSSPTFNKVYASGIYGEGIISSDGEIYASQQIESNAYIKAAESMQIGDNYVSSYISSSSSTTGYIKFPEMNLMICWGFYSGGGNKTITLPNSVAYANSTYTIATACGYASSTSNAYGQYTDQKPNGFKLIGGASDSSDCWITVGRYQ